MRTTYTIKTFLALGALACAFCVSANAAPIFKITELFAGLSGEDGTQDWIEVTNTGNMDGDTATLIYDDENPVVPNAGTLDSFVLSPGESAIFLLDGDAVDDVTYSNSIDEFNAIWGSPTPNVGLTNGGGNLGQGGDQANIGTDNGGVFDVVDEMTFDSALGGELMTVEDPTGMGTPALSMDGVNGAYESNAFFNDNLGLPNDTATLIGSPGATVPEPAAAMMLLLGLGSVAGLVRRR